MYSSRRRETLCGLKILFKRNKYVHKFPLYLGERSRLIAHYSLYHRKLSNNDAARIADYVGPLKTKHEDLSRCLAVPFFRKVFSVKSKRPKRHRKTFRRLRFVGGVRLQRERSDRAFCAAGQWREPHAELWGSSQPRVLQIIRWAGWYRTVLLLIRFFVLSDQCVKTSFRRDVACLIHPACFEKETDLALNVYSGTGNEQWN